MKTLYIHIGTHKTGTTSFQFFLKNYAEHLSDQIYVPFSPAHNIAWELTGDKRFSPDDEATLSNLLEHLQSTDRDRAIISSEDFEYLVHKPETIRFLEKN